MTNKKYNLKRKKNKIMKIILTGLLAFSLTGCKAKAEAPDEDIVLENIPRHIEMPEERLAAIDNSVICGFNNMLTQFSYLLYASSLEGFEITDEIREQVKYFAEFASCFKTNRRSIDGYFYYNLSDDGSLIVDSIISDILTKAIELDYELESYLNNLGSTETIDLNHEHVDSFNKNIESAIQSINIKNEDYTEEVSNIDSENQNNEVQDINEDYSTSEEIYYNQRACMIDINGNLLSWTYSYEAPKENCAIMAGSGSTTDGEGSYFIGHNPGPFTCVYNLDYGDPVTVYDADKNARTYSICDIFDVSQDSYFDDVIDRAMPGGETIAMQTCSGRKDNIVRILVAR